MSGKHDSEDVASRASRLQSHAMSAQQVEMQKIEPGVKQEEWWRRSHEIFLRST